MASDDPLQQIGAPRLLWARLISSLRRGGQGTRESGAFVLGHQDGSVARATRFVCYDSLDPKAYQGGAIQFHSEGYAALWQMCRESRLLLLCDVHTHPGHNVEQSHIDQRHPMVAVVGHTALIVPCFAHTSRWSLQGVGVYEYLGDFRWRTHELQSSRSRLFLTWW